MARALFIGLRSPLAAGALAGWLASGNTVAAFWSQQPGMRPDRFGAPRLGPQRLLRRHRIPSVAVPRLSRWPALVEEAAATGADVLITCATQMLVPTSLLERFGDRAVNIHPTMLPEYRGPSPYLPMLLDGQGDTCGGVTLHVLSPGIDEGDIIAQQRVGYTASGGDFTEWYARLIRTTLRMMRDDLPRYLDGNIAPRPQEGGSYVKLPIPYYLTPDLSGADVRRMLERAGSTLQLAVRLPDRDRDVRVAGWVESRSLGSTPPRLGALTVEMDFADARLVLRRATGIERRLQQWRLAWALRSLQL